MSRSSQPWTIAISAFFGPATPKHCGYFQERRREAMTLEREKRGVGLPGHCSNFLRPELVARLRELLAKGS